MVDNFQNALIIVLLQVDNLIVLSTDYGFGEIIWIDKNNISLHAVAEGNMVVEIRICHVLEEGKNIFYFIFMDTVIFKIFNDREGTHCRTVHALACHGVKDIRDGDNLGKFINLAARQPVGIAAAVTFLMVHQRSILDRVGYCCSARADETLLSCGS